MKLKDPCIDASCASMSDENFVNGDSSANSYGPRKECKRSDVNQEPAFKVSNSSCSDRFEGNKVDEKHRDSSYEGKLPRNLSPNSEGSSLCSGSVGGRLKFFKDGKFILELSHKKEGDKTCWIPVTKKPCWPPVGIPRPGSLTSLSASDDNSSLHSFSSQRDHRWKQPTPRANINKELEFKFHKIMNSKLRNSTKCAYSIRRRPFETSVIESIKNGVRSIKKLSCRRDDLSSVVQLLWDRVVSSKSEPDVVSPRKRILKEFEKVSLEESSKRQKGAVTGRVISTYSIATILEENDDSVLRTLLRSPSTSPDSVISHSSSVPPSYHPRDIINPLPQVHFPHNTIHFPPYRVPDHGFWPLHYPLSNSAVSLPVYPVPHYLTSARQQPQRIVNPDPFSDAPLNLSKHSG